MRRTEYFLPGTEPTAVCPEGAQGPEATERRSFLRWLDEWF